MQPSVASTLVAFTLRDLNRQPAKVLDAVRKFGSAEVRTRSGEVFTVARKKMMKKRRPSAKDIRARFEMLWKKQLDLGCIAPPDSENERINRIIAGEE